MARATFVKKARKDIPNTDIKAGDSYYWWAFMSGGRGGPKRYSKTRPRASQLTQSEFLSEIYAAQELLDAASDADSTIAALEDARSAVESAKDNCEDKLSNMPDSLQQGTTGQLLQDRIDNCERIISEIDDCIGAVEELKEHPDDDSLDNIMSGTIDWSVE